MFVMVYYGDEFCSLACEEYVSLDTPLCNLVDHFPGSVQVIISGDDFDA